MEEITDPLARICFDSAVIAFGTLVEAALQETFEIGAGETRRKIRRYTIKEILRPGMFLQRESMPIGDFNLLKGAEGTQYQEVTE